MANIGSMDDIQNLFKETIAEFMENGLEAELDEDLGYSRYDYKNKATDNSRNGHSSKMLRTSFGDVEVSVPRDRKGESDPQRGSILPQSPLVCVPTVRPHAVRPGRFWFLPVRPEPPGRVTARARPPGASGTGPRCIPRPGCRCT